MQGEHRPATLHGILPAAGTGRLSVRDPGCSLAWRQGQPASVLPAARSCVTLTTSLTLCEPVSPAVRERVGAGSRVLSAQSVILFQVEKYWLEWRVAFSMQEPGGLSHCRARGPPTLQSPTRAASPDPPQTRSLAHTPHSPLGRPGLVQMTHLTPMGKQKQGQEAALLSQVLALSRARGLKPRH